MADRNDETIDRLNDVLSEDLNAVRAYEEAVKNVDSPRLRQLFEELRQEREAFARELQDFTRQLGGDPVKEEDIGGSLRGAWMSLQASLSSDEADALVGDLERAEESLADAYDKAISRGVEPQAEELLQTQRRQVHAGEDRVRKIRQALESS